MDKLVKLAKLRKDTTQLENKMADLNYLLEETESLYVLESEIKKYGSLVEQELQELQIELQKIQKLNQLLVEKKADYRERVLKEQTDLAKVMEALDAQRQELGIEKYTLQSGVVEKQKFLQKINEGIPSQSTSDAQDQKTVRATRKKIKLGQ
jgi:chromosome segregation ATPase